jgi:arginase
MTRIALIGQPYDSALRDFRMGAGARILLERARRRLEAEDHDVEMTVVADEEAPGYEIRRTFELDRQLAAVVRDAVVHRRFPLVIAGNCNSAIGTTAGVAAGGAKLAVAWFDAHADFDVPEDNRSGFFDVFALSIVTGQAFQALAQSIPGFAPVVPERVVLTAVRDLDPYQEARLRGWQIRVVFADEVREAGLEKWFAPALGQAVLGASGLYLHVDLDCLDPAEGRANRYAAPAGLRRNDLSHAFTIIEGSGCHVVAGAITAYDEASDLDGRMATCADEIVAEMARRFGE